MYKRVRSEEVRRLSESQTVELKKSLSSQKEAFKALCGMINSDGATGTVIFGVSPDGNISGIEPGDLDSAQRKLAQNIRQSFDPPIISNIEVLKCEEKHLIILKADRVASIPYHEYDGRAYIREGSTKRQLSYDEKQQLAGRRNRDQHNGPWICDRCGTFVGMLSSIVVTDNGVKKSYDCQCGGEFWPAK